MKLPWIETLIEARKRLFANLDDGMSCPCCDQYAKRYRRKINAEMVRSLSRIYNKGGQSYFNWVYIPDMLLRSHEEGKLAYWGLLEELDIERDDGGRAGWWRVTRKGEAFLMGKLRVPKYAIVYNAACSELDATETVSVQDCLNQKFDLGELMGWKSATEA